MISEANKPSSELSEIERLIFLARKIKEQSDNAMLDYFKENGYNPEYNYEIEIYTHKVTKTLK